MSKERKRNKREFGPNMAPPEKAKDFKGTIKKLLDYMGKYKIHLIIVLITAIASCIFAIVGPKILGNATTELFEGLVRKVNGTGGIDADKITSILLFVLGIYIISALFNYVQGFIMAHVSQKTTYKMRKQINEKIDKLPMSYFDKKSHGEVLSIITNDVDTVSQSLSQSLSQLITSTVTIIGIGVMMFTINVPLALVSVLILPIAMVVIGAVVKKSQKHFKSQQEYLGHVNGKVEEMYGSHSIVRVFNGQEKVLNDFEKDNDKLYVSAYKSQFLSGLMQPIMNFVGNLAYVAVALLGGYLAIQGSITVGNIQSFIQYNKQFAMPLSQLAQVSNVIQGLIAASERIFAFLNEEEEEFATKPVKLVNVKGKVEFQNVKFGYDEDVTVINDFSAKVKPGQKIAIVGPTGAGKSTIIKLLMKFYNTDKGKILIDGVDINELSKKDLRSLFGAVTQDTWLFSGSIMDNIRYGRENASDNEVIEACKAAHVHHYIQTQPDTYNMKLDEETSNISGGQKQLLTIARAILADPSILILDEATSNVDTRTEVLIQKAMDELMKGRTSFVIAHRLSTIKNADLILVMNNGDIIEQGNHEELIKQNGFYKDLYNSQFEA